MKGKNVYFTREQLLVLREILITATGFELKYGREAWERGDSQAGTQADYQYSIGCELSIKINDAIGKIPSIQSTVQMSLDIDDEVPF